MTENKFEFSYEVYDNSDDLNKEDRLLLNEAKEATNNAYAPYSKFHVGAAALLANGKIVTGANQENASYPVGTCAERVLLGTISSQYPGEAIRSFAISYTGDDKTTIKSDHPISPCGMCRQALLEYENRVDNPIRLILAGMEGKVLVVNTVASLLPFAFTSGELL